MKRIYLDHASGTPVVPEVMTAMAPFWSETFANPSSIHADGLRAKHAMGEARRSIANTFLVHPDEVVFTGSATESCNLALEGTVRAWKRSHQGEIPHVIVSAIEHDAVLATAKFLEGEGAQISYLPVDAEGVVMLPALLPLITTNTVLVSVMLANNEVGTIQPIAEIAKLIRGWKKEHRGVTRDAGVSGEQVYPLLHTDATQATNYLPLRVPSFGVDLLTLNSAKIYGPKGIGVLVVRRGIPILPIIFGGAHEMGLRAGTENVPLIVGFAEALRLAEELREKELARLTPLRDMLISKLKKIENIIINGSLSLRLPNNVNFSVRGVDHEYLALLLDARGFSVATKSACNETDAETSHVLLALHRAGHSGEQNGIRITMGRGTIKEDLDAFIGVLKDVITTVVPGIEQ